MIRFDLLCGAEHAFEGWFRDGASFDEQARSGSLTCPVCGSSEVRKAVMAPAISRGMAPPAESDAKREQFAKALQVMRQVQDYVEKNFDNVGDRFAEEARRIHFGETPHRDIYGRATLEEASSLRREGIPVRPLPILPKLDA